MADVVDFTLETCFACPNTWDKCTPAQRSRWKPFIASRSGYRVRVCHSCAPRYTVKAHSKDVHISPQAQAHNASVEELRRVSPTMEDRAPQAAPHVPPVKLVSDAQRGTGRSGAIDTVFKRTDTCTGRTPVRAIGHSAGTPMNKQTPLPSGYTQSHGHFKQAEDFYRKKAGGITNNPTTVQVKVTMVRPVKKSTKITFTPINEVTLFLVAAH